LKKWLREAVEKVEVKARETGEGRRTWERAESRRAGGAGFGRARRRGSRSFHGLPGRLPETSSSPHPAPPFPRGSVGVPPN